MSGLELLGAAAVVVLVALAAVLALAETSLTHLGRARAQALEEARAAGEEGDDDAGILTELLERRGQVLNPILLLLLACHLTVAGLVAAWAYNRWGAGAMAVALVATILVVFVVAEAAPKTYALLRTGRVAYRVAPLARALELFFPLRWLTTLLIGIANLLIPGRGRPEGPTVTEEELLAVAGAAAAADVIEAEEQVLIESIIDFGDTVAREIMVPRTDMVTVDEQYRVGDVMEIAILNGFSRLPSYGTGSDDITGIVYAKDLMRAERDERETDPVRSLLRDAHFVPETKRVAELLREMQSDSFHIAIVVDEYGGTAGMVTLEDVIEELVGEIQDEFDRDETLVEHLGGGRVRVDARVPVDEVDGLPSGPLPEGDWDSVGGLLFSLLGRVPAEGESVEIDGYRLVAERVQRRRIGRVLITPLDGDDR